MPMVRALRQVLLGGRFLFFLLSERAHPQCGGRGTRIQCDAESPSVAGGFPFAAIQAGGGNLLEAQTWCGTDSFAIDLRRGESWEKSCAGAAMPIGPMCWCWGCRAEACRWPT